MPDLSELAEAIEIFFLLKLGLSWEDFKLLVVALPLCTDAVLLEADEFEIPEIKYYSAPGTLNSEAPRVCSSVSLAQLNVSQLMIGDFFDFNCLLEILPGFIWKFAYLLDARLSSYVS